MNKRRKEGKNRMNLSVQVCPAENSLAPGVAPSASDPVRTFVQLCTPPTAVVVVRRSTFRKSESS